MHGIDKILATYAKELRPRNPFVTRGADFETALGCAMAAGSVSRPTLTGHILYQLANGRWYWSRLSFTRHYLFQMQLAFIVWEDMTIDKFNLESE